MSNRGDLFSRVRVTITHVTDIITGYIVISRKSRTKTVFRFCWQVSKFLAKPKRAEYFTTDTVK